MLKTFAGKRMDGQLECNSEYKKLIDEAKSVLSDYKNVNKLFDSVKDPEIVEACVYELKALQAKYSYLMRLARQQDDTQKICSDAFAAE